MENIFRIRINAKTRDRAKSACKSVSDNIRNVMYNYYTFGNGYKIKVEKFKGEFFSYSEISFINSLSECKTEELL